MQMCAYYVYLTIIKNPFTNSWIQIVIVWGALLAISLIAHHTTQHIFLFVTISTFSSFIERNSEHKKSHSLTGSCSFPKWCCILASDIQPAHNSFKFANCMPSANEPDYILIELYFIMLSHVFPSRDDADVHFVWSIRQKLSGYGSSSNLSKIQHKRGTIQS